MSINAKAFETSEKVANQAHTQNPPSRKASVLQPLQDESDDQTHQTRPPTSFQELQGSLHDDSQIPKDERDGVTPPPDVASPGGDTGTLCFKGHATQGVNVAWLEVPLCEEGKHEFKTKHGIMGILMLIVRFYSFTPVSQANWLLTRHLSGPFPLWVNMLFVSHLPGCTAFLLLSFGCRRRDKEEVCVRCGVRA